MLLSVPFHIPSRSWMERKRPFFLLFIRLYPHASFIFFSCSFFFLFASSIRLRKASNARKPSYNPNRRSAGRRKIKKGNEKKKRRGSGRLLFWGITWSVLGDRRRYARCRFCLKKSRRMSVECRRRRLAGETRTHKQKRLDGRPQSKPPLRKMGRDEWQVGAGKTKAHYICAGKRIRRYPSSELKINSGG